LDDDGGRSLDWGGACLGWVHRRAASAARFALRRTTLNPAGHPAHLIVTGAHAWSRNPMYLSLTIIYVGMALVVGKAWPLVLVVLPWTAMNWLVIPFEESRLRKAFGQEYANYCRTVRRWL
jgi:protein-S-isoprenylcysteine O-methyltransferase Ste14